MLGGPMRRLTRSTVALGAVCLLGGCLDATNPCDPEASDDVRGRSRLSGVVKDQSGAPLAGVTVTIPGHATPAISGEDGSFRFEGLPPNAGPLGYEVIALADAPAVGGRTVAPPLGCEDEVSGVHLVVAVPPVSPEVEIVHATAPDRLFVAFSAAEGSARYTVELRAPFESWRPAVVATAPVVSDAVLVSPRSAAYESYRASALTDEKARAFCDAFRYALPTLAHDNARCAEVIGVREGDELRLLEEYGSYEVRVRAEIELDPQVVGLQRLPEVVRSAPAAVPGELSLVPTSVLPVMLAPDPTTHTEELRALDVHAMVPVSHGRFAMLGDGMGAEGMLIVGQAEVAAPGMYDRADGAPEAALAFDHSSGDAASEVREHDGHGLAILPAGRWVRVWKRSVDPVTNTVRSEVEKVFIGSQHRDEEHAEQPEPVFSFDLDEAGLLQDLRAFSWLVQPEGTLAGEGYNPVDGYLLLLRSGFVLLEREGGTDDDVTYLGAMADDMAANGALGMRYGETESNQPNAMTSGHCSKLGEAALGADGLLGERTIRACFDLEGALGQILSLSDVAILRRQEDATAPEHTYHVMTDTLGDRALVVHTRALLGHGGDPLLHHVVDLPLGVAPTAMAQSRLLSCAKGREGESGAEAVLLVANRGSQDISVVGFVQRGSETRVEEIGIVPMPGAPVRFFEDPDGPSCADPFVWVVLDDGRSVPVDLRREHLGVPRCGDDACAVRTSDRAPVGAVGRDATGKSRVLVGGRALLGEVGYLRPSAAAAKGE